MIRHSKILARFFMGAALFMVLSSCAHQSRQQLSDADISTPSETLESICKFDKCSPYYNLNFVQVQTLACADMIPHLKKACNLATNGNREAAWKEVEPFAYKQECISDLNTALAISTILGGYLEKAGWFIQMRLGPMYQSLVKRMYDSAPNDGIIKTMYALLLVKTPAGFGGDIQKGYTLLKQVEAESRGIWPALIYGLWYANSMNKNEKDAIQYAHTYLSVCPAREDVKEWCNEHSECKM